MTIELEALIRKPCSLAEVFAYAEKLVSNRVSLVLEGPVQPADIVVGPYEIRPTADGIRRAHSLWELDDLRVSAGRIAAVGLALGHVVSDVEMGFSSSGATEQQVRERAERAGYRAMLDAGGDRIRASFCLAALLACSIATLNHTRIIDDEGRLQQGVELVDPEVVAAMFVKHGQASCFEELADLFCAEVGFAPSWLDWRAALAAAERDSRCR